MTQAASDITAFGTPLFYDKVAAELNVKLSALGHFDDLYPVCYVGYDDDETFPEIYINDGSKKSLRVLPDSTGSMSFFIVTGDMTTDDDDRNMVIPMAYCVWMNLLKVDPSKQYDYTTEIMRDCYNVIDKYGGYDITMNVNDPYPEFTQLSKKITANLSRPYSGFRIQFNKTIGICI